MRGEILAVIGDNGAGKSTLIKALRGAVVPDQGVIRLDGQEVQFRSPLEARRHGIETVYQSLAWSPALSIADNMFLGREVRSAGLAGRFLRKLDHKAMQTAARRQLDDIGLSTIQDINPSKLSLAAKGRVLQLPEQLHLAAISFSWMSRQRLSASKSRRVLDLIMDVKKRGLSVVLISHKMPHVFEIADRNHIHRLGRRARVVVPNECSMAEAVSIMTGASG